MSVERDKSDILEFALHSGTIEVKAHPEDILEVEPEVLAIMQSRLKGESFDGIYGEEDRVSNELLIRREKEKITTVFASRGDVLEAFSSLKNIKEVRQELRYADLGRELIGSYLWKLSHGETVDEVDGYIALIDGRSPTTKGQRLLDFAGARSLLSKDANALLSAVSPYYGLGHFTPFTVTKEMIQLSPVIQSLFRSDRFSALMDELLAQLYRSSNG